MKTIVAIAMGGYSSEFQISLNSGNVVYKHIDLEKYTPYRVHILKEEWLAFDDENHSYVINKNDFLLGYCFWIGYYLYFCCTGTCKAHSLNVPMPFIDSMFCGVRARDIDCWVSVQPASEIRAARGGQMFLFSLAQMINCLSGATGKYSQLPYFTLATGRQRCFISGSVLF